MFLIVLSIYNHPQTVMILSRTVYTDEKRLGTNSGERSHALIKNERSTENTVGAPNLSADRVNTVP